MRKNNIKKFIVSAMALCLCLALSGCSIGEISVEELMRPPQLTASRKQVQETIDELLGASYQLIAPSGGEYRNGINLADLNDDGQNEAICLYTTGDTQLVEVLLLQKGGEEWTELGSYSSDATGVDKMVFTDLDADGNSELIIGWSYLTGSDRIMEVLKTRDQGRLASLYKGRYSQFVIIEDGARIVSIDLTGASATLLGYRSRQIVSLSSVPIDQRITAFTQLSVSTTTTGSPAIYVDTQLEDATYHTEILVINAGDYLENKLFTGGAGSADRALNLRCADIDGDGIIEVPTCVAMEDGEGAAYFTYWHHYDGTALIDPLTTFTGTADRFYFEYPAAWVGKILVRQDSKLQRLYHFVNKRHETVYSLRVFTVTEFSQVHPGEGWITITESEDTVIAYRSGNAKTVTFTTAQWAQALHTY